MGGGAAAAAGMLWALRDLSGGLFRAARRLKRADRGFRGGHASYGFGRRCYETRSCGRGACHGAVKKGP